LPESKQKKNLKVMLEDTSKLLADIEKTTELSLDGHRTVESHDSSSSLVLTEFPFDFGAYEILGEIGRGGMGVVYKGLQKDLDRLVAIKVILSNRLISRQNVKRFRKEAKSAAAIRHPNIVGIYEAGHVLGQHYIAMEYVEGENFAKRLRRKTMPLQDSLQIVSDVARAIGHLHSREIVHLDLKPSNILLDRDNKPYVTDFGLARGLGARLGGKNLDTVTGTPCYMAPEQARSDEWEIGPLSDVYGLGTVLYELLTGRPPFKEDDPFETLVEVIEGEVIPPRQIAPKTSKTIERICMKCLEKRPEKRYASPEAFADDLDRFMAGDLVESTATGLLDQIRCWVNREPPLASHLIVLAIFISIECLWYYVLHIRTSSYHYTLLSILLVWSAASVCFQRLLRNPHRTEAISLIWSASDVLFLSAALLNAEGVASHLLILYPILIAASGLWYHSKHVWVTTAVAMASYAGLCLHALIFRPDLQVPFDYHIVFLAALFSIGFPIALLVRRLERLKGYCRSVVVSGTK